MQECVVELACAWMRVVASFAVHACKRQMRAPVCPVTQGICLLIAQSDMASCLTLVECVSPQCHLENYYVRTHALPKQLPKLQHISNQLTRH